MIAKHCMLASRSKRPNLSTYGDGVCVLAEIWLELDITTWFLGKPECFERRQYIRRSARSCNQQSYEDEIGRHVSLTDYCEPGVLLSLSNSHKLAGNILK